MNALFLILIAMIGGFQSAPISDWDTFDEDYNEPDLTFEDIYEMEKSSPLDSYRQQALENYKTLMQQEHWKAYLRDMNSIQLIHLKSKCIAMVSFANHIQNVQLVDQNYEMEFHFLEHRIDSEYLKYLKLADSVNNAAKMKAAEDEQNNSIRESVNWFYDFVSNTPKSSSKPVPPKKVPKYHVPTLKEIEDFDPLKSYLTHTCDEY